MMPSAANLSRTGIVKATMPYHSTIRCIGFMANHKYLDVLNHRVGSEVGLARMI
jgi:hypothetical protein